MRCPPRIEAERDRSSRPASRCVPGALLADGASVVAMLSGGRDFVCLLDVAVALCGPGARTCAACQLRLARRLPDGRRGALSGAV